MVGLVNQLKAGEVRAERMWSSTNLLKVHKVRAEGKFR